MPRRAVTMIRGQGAIRFGPGRPEAAAVAAVRQALGGLGRVALDSRGAIRIDPGEVFPIPLGGDGLGQRRQRP